MASTWGAIILHGPHQTAQKSTTAGLSALRMVPPNVASVTSIVLPAMTSSRLTRALARCARSPTAPSGGRIPLRAGAKCGYCSGPGRVEQRFVPGVSGSASTFCVMRGSAGPSSRHCPPRPNGSSRSVPGQGALTRLLLERFPRVRAAEFDARLAADLPARLGQPWGWRFSRRTL